LRHPRGRLLDRAAHGLGDPRRTPLRQIRTAAQAGRSFEVADLFRSFVRHDRRAAVIERRNDLAVDLDRCVDVLRGVVGGVGELRFPAHRRKQVAKPDIERRDLDCETSTVRKSRSGCSSLALSAGGVASGSDAACASAVVFIIFNGDDCAERT
jgi:hypothetical protein